MKCPVCGEVRNLARTKYIEGFKAHENVLCARCGRRSLVFHIKHLILRSGNLSFKFRKCVALINGEALSIGEDVIITKIGEKYAITVMGETVILNGFKKPPAPLSLLK